MTCDCTFDGKEVLELCAFHRKLYYKLLNKALAKMGDMDY